MVDSELHASPATDDRLATRLLAPGTFPHLVDDCTALVAAEMKNKGMAMRTAFKLVQKTKPDILERTVRELMPEFIRAIEPCYTDYRARDLDDFRAYLVAHDTEVADSVLTVTDRRAERIANRAIRSAYDRVRGRARREIVEAMPELATIIAKHA